MAKRHKNQKLRLLRNSRFGRRFGPPLLAALLFGAIGSVMYFSFAAPGDIGDTSNLPAPVTNPSIISQSCLGGLDVAFVADVSGSIRGEEFSQMQTAMKDFVSALLPSTHTAFSLVKFDNDAQILQYFTSNVSDLNSSIDGLTGGGHTNWAAGLQAGFSTFSGVKATSPRLLIIATDGDPNLPEGSALVDAVNIANTIKSSGIHILALGLGTDPTISNMQAITGNKINTGGVNSDVITTDFANMNTALQNIAKSTCNSGTGTGNSGTGTGNGGTGSGNGGTGTGTNGNGTGTGGTGAGSGGTGTGTNGSGKGTVGTGTGSIGKGTGVAVGTKTQPSPSPSPVINNSTTPSPAPTNTPNPDPAPAPIAVATPEPQPDPAPTPTAQGTKTNPPKQTPSPFFDGKQYPQGSVADDGGADIAKQSSHTVLYVLATVAAAMAGAGLYYWRRRKSQPQGSGIGANVSPRKKSRRR